MKLIRSRVGKGPRVIVILLVCMLLLSVVASAVWAQAVMTSSYIVRPGDSYGTIATRHGISLSQLQDLNTHLNVYGWVPVGQSLRVPIGGMHAPSARHCPVLHIVNPNETLAWISGAYGVAVGDLAYLNHISPNAAMFPGAVLCLPAHARLWGFAPVQAGPVITHVLPAVPPRAPPIPTAGVRHHHTLVGPWTGYFYNHLGTPTYVTSHSAGHINFNWGTASPAVGVAADYFSGVWMGDFYFTGQNYRFTALADDGVRVWVGDTLVIDGWKEQAATLYYKNFAPSRGTHTVRVEYYDASMNAQLMVDWAPN